MASDMVSYWVALAWASLWLGLIGLLVGAYGAGLAWGAARRVRGSDGGVRLVGLGDALLLSALAISSAQQVGVGAVLVWLAGSYRDELRVVLDAIGGGILLAYVGYVVQVAITSCLAPCYLTFRALTIRASNADGGRAGDADRDGDAVGTAELHRGIMRRVRGVGGDRDADL